MGRRGRLAYVEEYGRGWGGGCRRACGGYGDPTLRIYICVTVIGRDGEIRTRDPLHPMQVRYQAAPRPDCGARILSSQTMTCNS